MATRVRQRISAVLDWADLHDFREGNPVTGKALETALARRDPPSSTTPLCHTIKWGTLFARSGNPEPIPQPCLLWNS